MTAQPEGTKPWYRQFWPWFIIALPASVVVAGITTVFIAFDNADSLVDDNYFSEGLAINMRLEQDQLAEQMGISAAITWDAQTGEMMLKLSTLSTDSQITDELQNADMMELQLLHPAQQDMDQQLQMMRVAPGYFRVSLDRPLNQRYYLRVAPLPDRQWRLSGEMDFKEQATVTLGH